MAADVFEQQFTQIYNGLFRDTRLSFKAKGIFGLISTHRDGFGISLESIAACSTDGIAGVRTGLQELIAFNYLQRDRARDDMGRLGESVYFITDMPDGLVILMNPGWDAPEVETGRSEPKCDSPTLAEPTLDDRSDKKTTSKHTNSKKTLSPRLPRQQQSKPTERTDEREISAAPQNHNSAGQIHSQNHNDQAQQVAAAWHAARGGRRNPSAEQAIANSAAVLLAAGWPLADVIALAQDMAAKYPAGRDLSRHADHWQPPKPATPQHLALVLPDWCGECAGGDDIAATDGSRRWIDLPDGSAVRCHCHPAKHNRAA